MLYYYIIFNIMNKQAETIVYILAALVILIILFRMVSERESSTTPTDRVTDVVYVNRDDYPRRVHFFSPKLTGS